MKTIMINVCLNVFITRHLFRTLPVLNFGVGKDHKNPNQDYQKKWLWPLKEAGNSFQHFSNSYTLKGEYYHRLTSDVTITVSYKCPITGKQVAFILPYHSNNMTC